MLTAYSLLLSICSVLCRVLSSMLASLGEPTKYRSTSYPVMTSLASCPSLPSLHLNNMHQHGVQAPELWAGSSLNPPRFSLSSPLTSSPPAASTSLLSMAWAPLSPLGFHLAASCPPPLPVLFSALKAWSRVPSPVTPPTAQPCVLSARSPVLVLIPGTGYEFNIGLGRGL